jgi:predicted DNA-binding transcriptional regulator AlpA
MVFPKDFPKDSKIRVQNFHIYALSLVMNELLKVRDIQARLGIGRSAVYALIHEPSFPAPIAINSRILRWEVTEFEQWLLSKKSSLKPKTQKQISPKGKVFVINGVRFRKGE